jgi:hypothetical protein
MDNRRDVDIKYRGAVLQSDGSYLNRHDTKRWFNEAGETHRDDGPAIIYDDGEVSWMLNDKIYAFGRWCVAANISDEDKMMLRLQYE